MFNRLQELRLERNMSQKEVAKATNIPYSTYVKYETEHLDINGARLLHLLKICIVLDCKLTDILTDADLVRLVKKYNRAHK